MAEVSLLYSTLMLLFVNLALIWLIWTIKRWNLCTLAGPD